MVVKFDIYNVRIDMIYFLSQTNAVTIFGKNKQCVGFNALSGRFFGCPFFSACLRIHLAVKHDKKGTQMCYVNNTALLRNSLSFNHMYSVTL